MNVKDFLLSELAGDYIFVGIFFFLILKEMHTLCRTKNENQNREKHRKEDFFKKPPVIPLP